MRAQITTAIKEVHNSTTCSNVQILQTEASVRGQQGNPLDPEQNILVTVGQEQTASHRLSKATRVN